MFVIRIGFVPLQSPITHIRAIKEEEEIQRIKESANLNAKGFRFAASLLKENITEEEVAHAIELFFKRRGREGSF